MSNRPISILRYSSASDELVSRFLSARRYSDVGSPICKVEHSVRSSCSCSFPLQQQTSHSEQTWTSSTWIVGMAPIPEPTEFNSHRSTNTITCVARHTP
jgi:hypothetical protein